MTQATLPDSFSDKANEPTASNAGVNKLYAYVIPVGVVALVLLSLIAIQNSAESAVAGVANWLPVGWAFAAGMVASVNPCGFLLLPSYLSYQLGNQEEGFYEQSTVSRLGRALILGGVATAGFLLILAVVGVGIAAGGQALVRVFPLAGVAIGVIMAGLGLYLLVTHRTLGIMSASRVTITPEKNLRNVFSFGVVYAVGSLSCTLPIFLVVVGGSLAAGDAVASFLQFIGYALGMGSVLIAVTIGAALFRGAVSKGLRRVMPYVHTMSALFLVGAGLYLVYYWVFITGAF
ncbi:MAG: cytochrome c biogenesis protein CcdA [Proteobacteria bacterium]|nr:cytochrome c biogenesis protein CcdA [Pseudomonadota bacterium]